MKKKCADCGHDYSEHAPDLKGLDIHNSVRDNIPMILTINAMKEAGRDIVLDDLTIRVTDVPMDPTSDVEYYRNLADASISGVQDNFHQQV